MYSFRGFIGVSPILQQPRQQPEENDLLRLGISVHSLHEARVAEERGADYLFYGHVFSSSSKPGSKPRGLSALSEICSAVSIPVIAIGGIGPANIAAVRAAGASGAAVISSIWASDSSERSSSLEAGY